MVKDKFLLCIGQLEHARRGLEDPSALRIAHRDEARKGPRIEEIMCQLEHVGPHCAVRKLTDLLPAELRLDRILEQHLHKSRFL